MTEISRSIAKLVLTWRWYTLATLMVLTSVFGYLAVSRLSIDNSIESWANQDAPEIKALYKFRETFGRADAFVLMVEGDVFSETFLNRLKALHRDLENLRANVVLRRRTQREDSDVGEWRVRDDFDEADEAAPIEEGGDERVVDRVVSLVNIRRITGGESGIRVEKLLDKPPSSDEMMAFKEQVLKEPFYVGQVVDKTGRYALVTVIPEDMSEDELLKLNPVIKQLITHYEQPGFGILLTGLPAVAAEINGMVKNDFFVLGSISLVLVIFVLVILFKSRVGLVGPCLVVMCSVIWTTGFMALVGFSLSILSTILPAFLFCVGVADSVHFLSLFSEQSKEHDLNARIVSTASLAGAPIFFTTLTTMGGLLSLGVASVDVVSELGIAGGAGVFAAWVLSVTLIPVLLSFERLSFSKVRAQADEKGWRPWDIYLVRLVNLSAPTKGPHRLKQVLSLAVLLFVGAVFGVTKLSVRHDDLEMVPKNSSVRVAVETLDEHIGGASVAEIVLSGPSGSMKSAKVVRAIDAFIEDVASFSDDLSDAPLVSHVTSVVDVVKETHKAFQDNRATAYTIPSAQPLLSQLLMVFELQSPEDSKQLATLDWSMTHVRLQVRWREATAYQPLVVHIEKSARRHFGEGITVQGTGPVYIASGLVGLLLSDLSRSFGSAFVLVSLLMILMLRDLRLGLIAMLPNLFPIVIVLGLMGWSRLPIDLNSLLVASIALGIAVDDTVHFLHHFRRNFRQSRDVEQALNEAVRTAGRAMVATSVILVSGFLVFLFASTHASMRFGLLTALTIVSALIVDLVVLPAVLRLCYQKQVRS